MAKVNWKNYRAVCGLNKTRRNICRLLAVVFSLSFVFSNPALSANAQNENSRVSINVSISDFKDSDGKTKLLQNYEGKNSVCIMQNESGFVEWNFEVDTEADYVIEVEYYTVAGKGVAISRNIYMDGKIPFLEANGVEFNRVYTNETAIKTDSKGNEIRPSQVEKPMWQKKLISDPTGFIGDALTFHLTAGKHLLKFEAVREPMVISAITLRQKSDIASYKSVEQDYEKNGYKNSGNVFEKIQGEAALYKSDSMLYPVSDLSSPQTETTDPFKLKLNTIGGDKWKYNGQWIIWEFEVTQDGLYHIAIKGRQNVLNGASSNRKLFIDNVIPFKEMEQISFGYNTEWQNKLLSDGNTPYQFYLTKGKHELKLEVTIGSMSALLKKVNESIDALSKIYRKILMLTGPSPDTYRDYQYAQKIPDALEMIKEQTSKFKEYIEEFKQITGQNGEQAQILRIIYNQLDEMNKDSEKITAQFSSLEGNISSLGSWLVLAKQQPLEIDYLTVLSSDMKIDSAKASFLSNLIYQAKSFFASFIVDYNDKTNSSDSSTIKVWLGASATAQGRDQAQVIKQMVINDFTPKSNVKVNLQLVAPGVLMPSTLAGKNPDVALSLGGSDPVNFAVRNAVVDVSKFKDYSEIAKRFTKSSIVPLTFNNAVYGLPESQTFYMMFYREDILKELGLEVPKTWKDVITMIPVLQKKQLNFGLPIALSNDATGVGLPAYAMFLFQRNGSFYSTKGDLCNLSGNEAQDAFYYWTSFYNNFGLPMQYDFANRFRTGTIPIGIADYGTYNMLSVFAPEIQGKWQFTTVPGTLLPDGTIDNSVSGNTSACVIMKKSKKQNESWEFLKWWTDSPTEVKYAKELESIMGTAARYAPANMEALYQIPWSPKEYNAIVAQREWVKGIPEVPGGYFTPRYLDFAFKQVCVYKTKENLEAGEILNNAVKSINNEIEAKRKEFGLN